MLNLSSPDLESSRSKVFSSTSADWAVYTIDKTESLKLAETGKGLEEFKEELIDDGKILFGIVRIQDSDTGLYKIVFVSFLGDGVPVSSKGKYHQYISTLSSFFKGFHVHIQARSEADVEPEQMLQKVKDSSGAKYKIREMDEVDRDVPFYSRKSIPKEKDIKASSNIFIFNLKVSQHTHLSQVDQQNRKPSLEELERTHEEARYLADEQRQVRERQARGAGKNQLGKDKLDRQRLERELKVNGHQEVDRIHELRQERERLERLERERLENEQHLEKQRVIIQEKLNAVIDGVSAVALYDYEKDEENEINLREGEQVSNVTDLGDGWYSGTSSSGQTGLFPGNYVEITNTDNINEKPEKCAIENPEICAVALVRTTRLSYVS